MPSQPFDGFEKSAPKSLPNTRGDAEGVRRRRVEDDQDLTEGMVIPSLSMAQSIHATTPEAARPVEIESAEEVPAGEELPRKRKRVEDSPRAARAQTREAAREAPRDASRDLTPPAALPPVARGQESAWDSSYPPPAPIPEPLKAMIAQQEERFEQLLEKQNELQRLQQKLYDRITASIDENKKKDVMLSVVCGFVFIAFVVVYLLQN